jgi:phage shock protein PspC (stress-responsive transcriptional regulator)
MIAGVVGGIAEYLGVDPTLARVIWVVGSQLLPHLLVLSVPLYIALVLIIPQAPEQL